MPSGKDEMNRQKLIGLLQDNWRAEMESAATYRALAAREGDPVRRNLLLKLASMEEEHASRWEERLKQLGSAPPSDVPSPRWLTPLADYQAALRKAEEMERRRAEEDAAQAEAVGDPVSAAILRELAQEDRRHVGVLRAISRGPDPRTRLESILRRERWHVSTGSWLGDAIYGVNDGLGAVFGIVSGVSGATGGSHFVLIAGLAGMIASALSMGSGAYLATKAEREVYEAELHRERREIEEHPDEEREELELFYQLRGFTPEEAASMAERLAGEPKQMLEVLASEELGLARGAGLNPVLSGLTAGVSTALGAFIPIMPFFFSEGMEAIIMAAVISIIGHFAVGAAKSLVTLRSWWVSGLEMTAVGVAAGIVTYALGLLAGGLGA